MNTRPWCVVLAITSAFACNQKGRVAPRLPLSSELPLLVEHNLPATLSLRATDSVFAQVTVRNRSESPVLTSFGSGAFKLLAQPIRASVSVPNREGRILSESAKAWGAVDYRETPSPNAIYTAELYERLLTPGESLGFAWRAGPLPPGEYRLTACVDLVVRPRVEEAAAQQVRWCAARQPRLVIN